MPPAATVQKGFLQIAGLSLLTYPLAIASQMLVSFYFGTSPQLDAYWVALALATLAGFFILPAREAMVPEFFRRNAADPEDGARYLSRTANGVLLLTLTGSAALVLFPRPLASWITGGKPGQIETVVGLCRALAPFVALTAATEMLNGVLICHHRVAFQQAGRLLGAAASVLLLSSLARSVGILALVASVLSALLVLLVLQIRELRALGFRYYWSERPSFDSAFLKLFTTLLASYGLSQLYVLVERRTLTLLGTGTLSAFQYGRSLTAVPEQIFIASMMTALWPHFMAHRHEGDARATWNASWNSVRYLTTALAGATLFCWVYADAITHVAFFRGAFNARSAAVTATALRAVSLSLCPLGVSYIFGRVLLSHQRSKALFAIGTGSTIAGVATLWLAGRLGSAALAFHHVFLSALTGTIITMALSLRMMRVPLTPQRTAAFLGWLLRFSAVCGALFLLFGRLQLPEGKPFALSALELLGAAVAFGLLFLATVPATGLVRLEEFRSLLQKGAAPGGPIRVLIIAPRFGSIRRGMETFVSELASRIDKRAFSVTVLSSGHEETIPDVRFIRRPTIPRELWSTRLESLALMISSTPFLLRESFDVVLPFGGSWTYLFSSMFCRPAKIVSVGHAGPVRFELERSDLFVGITPFGEQEARDIRPQVPTRHIPNGVDTRRFRPHQNGARRAPPVILCVAALVREKHQDLLLDAASRIAGGCRVALVGSGPEKKSLELHPLARAGRVEFHEAAPAEMPACYQRADAFSLPCPDEPFGIVFLEALASGLNVVAHDGPRQRYVLGDAGFFCDVFDADAYAKTLAEALSKPQADRNMERARRFDWDKIVRRYEEVLRETLAL